MCGIVGQSELMRSQWLERERELLARQGLDHAAIDNYIKELERQLQVPETNYRIIPGSKGLIILPDGESRMAFFGYNFDYKGRRRYVFNVRCEGGFRNKDDDPTYDGPWDIFSNPYIKDYIFTQRCLIPADFYVEGPGDRKIKRKYVIRRRDGQGFFIGGAYTDTVNEDTGEVTTAFCILTMAANSLTAAINHPRSPLIIPDERADQWLTADNKEEIQQCFEISKGSDYEAYEVDYQIAKRKIELEDDDPQLVEPMGEVITVDNL